MTKGKRLKAKGKIPQILNSLVPQILKSLIP